MKLWTKYFRLWTLEVAGGVIPIQSGLIKGSSLGATNSLLAIVYLKKVVASKFLAVILNLCGLLM
ncbi:hypothetical protein BpHYR1_006572 [Brachionus plicatilis]|uniref:Uncharacterized protein n=1 Tax=Brachionus plicatilis TaxID=10195 RepID=A0A3M7QCW4_BRAPC|nr:hypothetical protein BpHYR1_006572 [Brachionus plicatilis]